MEGDREEKTIGVFMLKGKSIKEIRKILPALEEGDACLRCDYPLKLPINGKVYYKINSEWYVFIGHVGLVFRNKDLNSLFKIEDIWNQQ